MAEDKKKMRLCPHCKKDMEVGGICPACSFDEAEAEQRAWGQAYVNRRSKQIEQEMEEEEKTDKKGRRGSSSFFRS